MLEVFRHPFLWVKTNSFSKSQKSFCGLVLSYLHVLLGCRFAIFFWPSWRKKRRRDGAQSTKELLILREGIHCTNQKRAHRISMRPFLILIFRTDYLAFGACFEIANQSVMIFKDSLISEFSSHNSRRPFEVEAFSFFSLRLSLSLVER